MKTLILSLVLFVGTAAGQAAIPCLVNTARFDPLRYTPPVWELPPASTRNFKIQPGGQWMLPIWMPVAGRCVGSFDSYDDRDDVAVAVMDAFGKYIRVQPAGDIEVLFLDRVSLDLRLANRSHSNYYSSGRQFSGSFAVDLPPGMSYLLLSNKHSFAAPKSVNLTLGRPVKQ